jgi:hypothetical protein
MIYEEIQWVHHMGHAAVRPTNELGLAYYALRGVR